MNQSESIIGLATIPMPERSAALNSQGTCIVNVDGNCVAGGVLIAGRSGYDVASMAPPGATCAAFPLFCSVKLPYTASQPGYQCATNANQLNKEIHLW
jgi:hypothetical protein